MKKVIFILVLFCLIITPATVLAASASLTGPGTVRAGNTITLTFNISGSGILGGSGTLAYDSSQLTLTGISKKIASPWVVDFNGNRFVCYDDKQSSPINSKKAIFAASFKVNNKIATGTKIGVSVTGTTTSDGNTDSNVGTASYSTTIAAPLSQNANVSALTITNATLSPSFSSSRTSYTATVPYTVKSVSISATKADAGAKVSVSGGKSLKVGKNTASIKVTAASGATKTYTITITRKQDPNYVPSNNASLESITLDNGILSPAFNVETTDYIVYLPFEITSITTSGKAVDAKAQSVRGETKVLSLDENETKITVTAEDGTTKTYKITAVRMPEYGVEPMVDPVETETPEPDPEDVSTTDDPVEATAIIGVPIWQATLMLFIGIPIGAGSVLLLNKKKDAKHTIMK
ncbi:MAG: cadherin-like beta sandwich domain-containing protein [Firmicutes bacterium]|nr:cadherin-like beta sandwich domain-containing protein [Bacillota bacterium]